MFNILPISLPKDLNVPSLPDEAGENEIVGKDLYPLPPLIMNISVTSLIPVPVSCTIFWPKYKSPSVVASSKTMWSVEVVNLPNNLISSQKEFLLAIVAVSPGRLLIFNVNCVEFNFVIVKVSPTVNVGLPV